MSKKNEKEELKKKTRKELHTTTHKKIQYISSKNRISQREVYKLITEFFEELLELHYEFSHEELIEELKKTFMEENQYEEIVLFLKKIGQIEFTKKEFNQEELKEMLKEMHQILDKLIHHEERKKTFWSKIHSYFFKEETPLERLDKEVIQDEKILEEKIIKQEVKKNKNTPKKTIKKIIKQEVKKNKNTPKKTIKKIKNKSENEEKLLGKEEYEKELMSALQQIQTDLENKNQEKAEEHYEKALTHYEKLHKYQQKKYFPVLNELYNLINIKQEKEQKK